MIGENDLESEKEKIKADYAKVNERISSFSIPIYIWNVLLILLSLYAFISVSANKPLIEIIFIGPIAFFIEWFILGGWMMFRLLSWKKK